MAPKQENFDDEKVGLVRDFPLMFFSPISYIVAICDNDARACHFYKCTQLPYPKGNSI